MSLIVVWSIIQNPQTTMVGQIEIVRESCFFATSYKEQGSIYLILLSMHKVLLLNGVVIGAIESVIRFTLQLNDLPRFGLQAQIRPS
jgi:hypothetical protein